MRLTIDIDERSLLEIQRRTGLHKKSPAVRKALEAYLHDRARKEFLARVAAGKTDYAMSNDEVEELATYDAD